MMTIRVPLAQSAPAVTYSATAINADPTIQMIDMTVTIGVDQWSTDADRTKAVSALADGAAGQFFDVLQKSPKVGSIRMPDTLGYDLRYAHRVAAADGGERIVLITDHYIGFWQSTDQVRPMDYAYTVVELHLDTRGQGEGKVAVATNIKADRASGEITLENYSAQPVRLTDIKRQPK
jgi:hypothetical protein